MTRTFVFSLYHPDRSETGFPASLLATTTCAALRKESRIQTIKATGLHQPLMLPEALLSPLSSRPERSEVERSLCGCSFLEV